MQPVVSPLEDTTARSDRQEAEHRIPLMSQAFHDLDGQQGYPAPLGSTLHAADPEQQRLGGGLLATWFSPLARP